MSNRPRPFVGMVLLLALGSMAARSSVSVTWVVLVLLGIGPLWLLSEYRGWAAARVWFCILVILVGWVGAEAHQPAIRWNGEKGHWTGRVIDTRQFAGRQELTVGLVPFYLGKVRVISDGLVDLAPGSLIRIRGEIDQIEPAANPGEFSQRAYWAGRQVYGQILPEAVELIDKPPWWAVWKNELDRFLATNLRAHVNQSGLIAALTLGDRSGITPEQTAAWRRLGISHLMAISGTHIGVAAAALGLLAGRSGLVLILLLAYVLLSGGRISAWRAWLFACLAWLGRTQRRRVDLLHIWSLAACLILLFWPEQLYQVGFQLSFAATGSLALWAPLVARTGRFRFLAVSLAAQLGTAPLLVWHFGELALGGPFFTILFLPLITLVLLCGFVLLVAGQLLPFLGWFVDQLTALVWWLTEVLLPRAPFLPNVSIRWPVLVAWYLLFGGLAYIWRPLVFAGRQRRWFHSTLLLGVALAIISIPPAWYEPLWVVVLDVGQGDAIYIRTPMGRHVLIDGGGDSVYWQERGRNVGRDTLLPFLDAAGVQRLDLVLLSHPHEDHLFGLLAVLEDKEIGLVADSGLAHLTPSYQRYLDLIAAKGIPYQQVRSGDSFTLSDGTRLSILHPPSPPLSGTSSDQNNNSVVVLLEYFQHRFLFAGDLDIPGQQSLLSSQLADVDWLKVPHHGSSAGWLPEFYEALQPSTAIISVGANPFGHPAQRVTQGLTNRGIEVHRTDWDGAAVIWFWGPWSGQRGID